MKSANFFRLRLNGLLLCAVTMAGGCSTTAVVAPSERAASSTGYRAIAAPIAGRNPLATAPDVERAGWSWYRDYAFNFNSDDIRQPDESTAQEIADYIRRNPSLRVALDGAIERRVRKVRDALILAGVPQDKVQIGALGDPQRRRASRVTVLVSR